MTAEAVRIKLRRDVTRIVPQENHCSRVTVPLLRPIKAIPRREVSKRIERK